MITSTSNSKVKYVRRLQADKRFRRREQAFVVEGARWLAEFTRTAHPLSLVLATAAWQETAVPPDLLTQLDAPVQLVSDEVMAAMSDTETPPGILGIAPIRPRPLPPHPSLILILDRIRDPGNLGTMLRTGAAAGVDAVLLGPGCVDAYNPKVVRGSMGALLRLSLHHLDWGAIGKVVQGMAVWLAAVEGDQAYTIVPWGRPSALIIGSEAHGAGAEALSLSDGRVAIPMHDETESLNAAVAAGVILFEAVRQRRLPTN